MVFDIGKLKTEKFGTSNILEAEYTSIFKLFIGQHESNESGYLLYKECNGVFF